LGVRALVAAVRGGPVGHHAGRATGCYRQGLISNLANPKMAVFFTSLLPQFGGASFSGPLPLGLVFRAMTLVWLGAHRLPVAKAGDVLRRSRVRRTLDAVTGSVLLAFGLRLAAESRP